MEYTYGKVFSILPSNNQLVLTVPSSFIFNVCVYSSNRPKNRSTITRMTDDEVHTFREGNYLLVKPKAAISQLMMGLLGATSRVAPNLLHYPHLRKNWSPI